LLSIGLVVAAAATTAVPAHAELLPGATDTATAVPVTASGPLAGGADLAVALRLEAVVDRHLWYRQAYEIDFVPGHLGDPGPDSTDPALRFPNVRKLNAEADSALWTGTYLASQSFRYRVANHYLAGRLTGKDRAFWAAQKAEALARIRPLLDQYHLLSNISKEWKASLDPHSPQVLQEDGNHFPKLIDMGVTPWPGGEPGLLFRSCIPDGASRSSWDSSQPFPSDRVYGPFPWSEPGSSTVTMYDCEDGTSRDAYAGAVFGMLTAYDFVDPSDLNVGREDGSTTNLHEQVGKDLLMLSTYLAHHGWSTPRPTNHLSTSNDLSSFFSPLMVYTPGARQHMIQVAKHVAHTLPGADPTEWDALWAAEVATGLEGEVVSGALDTQQPTHDYYKWNLGHLTGFDTLRLETDPVVRTELRRGFAVMDATTRDDVNAHFETVTYALTGETGRRDAAVEHLREWRDWRAKLDHPTDAQLASGVLTVDNSAVCASSGGCKADEYNDEMTTFTVDGPLDSSMLDQPCGSPVAAGCRAVNVIAVKDRPPTDFLWQRSPFQLAGGRSVWHESQGFDYLLPYWMLRFYTETAARPTVAEPFPAWVGPTYS
jgi:hypothetical protein